MTPAGPIPPGASLRVILGLSRARLLPLRLAYEGHDQVRVVAACTSAAEVLAVLERREADGAVVDEDLRGLDRARLDLLKQGRWPVALLSRRPDAAQ